MTATSAAPHQAGAAGPAGAGVAGSVTCVHCGLPVPAGLVEPAAAIQFCCAGCRAVYEMIQQCGLGRYYDLKTEVAPAPGRPTGERFEAFDDPAFHDRHVRRAGEDLEAVELYLDGVHCAACVWLVEKLPAIEEGVVESRLDYRRRIVRVVWAPRQTALSRIARRLDTLGYRPHPCAAAAVDAARRQERRDHLLRAGVAGALAGNVMLIAFALYGGMLAGMEEATRTFLRGVSLVLTVIALAWPGRVFFAGAFSALRAGTMHMDLPVAIALAAGTIWGAANTVRGVGEVYFESLTAVVFLLLVGRWLQHRQEAAAREAVGQLYDLAPSTARRLDDGGAVREVPVDALEPGMLVELRAGDAVPADGVVIEGRSEIDASLLTGESTPGAVGPGDAVNAGTVNLTARVVVRATATGSRTRVGRLMALIERLSQERVRIVRLADRIARHFVRAVLGLALATVTLWWWIDPSRAVEHAIALLIVTCPCALGLATPLAVVASVGRAARAGLMIKGGDAIEPLAGRGLMLLDKTGTLTRGVFAVTRWWGADDVKPLVAALESQVAHPIAAALVSTFGDPDPDQAAARAAHLPGRGVEGVVAGRRLCVGAPEHVRASGGEVPEWAAQAHAVCRHELLTPVFVAVDGRVVGVAGLGDALREDAVTSVRELRRLGWSIGVLSGDDPVIVDAIVHRLGIDVERCEGGAPPERKVAVVREAMEPGRTVVMVGDGVNDAAALAAATVGVAVHGGAEASLIAADVYLQRPGLAALVELVRGSRRTLAVIRRNLLGSLVYNLVTASLAIGGLINPLVAATLMPLSSLAVVTSSYRSRTYGGVPRGEGAGEEGTTGPRD